MNEDIKGTWEEVFLRNEQIAALQEFLKRGQLRINREGTIYLILHIDENGKAQVYRNPEWERRYTQITLTDKEIASLAHLIEKK